jgi:hypothetical protein
MLNAVPISLFVSITKAFVFWTLVYGCTRIIATSCVIFLRVKLTCTSMSCDMIKIACLF